MEKPDRRSEGNKFPKEERLKSKKIIEELFNKGSSVYLYPYRIFFIPGPPEPSCLPQVLFTVPRRGFKKSVDRNRLRRQMKEVYRLNKNRIFGISENKVVPAYLAIVYTSKEKIPFEILREKLILILERLKNNKP